MISQTIKTYELDDADKLISFIKKNPLNLGGASLARLAELTNSMRENNSAYYTNKYIVNEIYKDLPEFEEETIHILEPSVGVGNFLPFIFKKYETIPKVQLDVMDIDERNLTILRLLLEKIGVPENVQVNYIYDDFLIHKFDEEYDLVIGNPPFTKLKAKDAAKYLIKNVNKNTTTTFEFFLEKSILIGRHVAMITPKSLLNTPEFAVTRKLLSAKNIYCF